MNRLFLLAPLTFTLAAAVPGAHAQGTAIEAAESTAPLGLTVEEAYGDTLRYDFGTRGDGDRFHLDVVFRPDEVEWWELWEGGTTETDPTQSVCLDAHRMMATWPEQNGFTITLFADFEQGVTSFCGSDGTASQCRTGTIARRGGPSPVAAPAATPVYTILEITVHDDATYQRYREAVAPIIAAHGGRYVVRAGAARIDPDPNAAVVSPEGDWHPDRIIVLAFPSRAALDEFVTSPEYRAVAPLRTASATTRSVVVNGYAGDH